MIDEQNQYSGELYMFKYYNLLDQYWNTFSVQNMDIEDFCAFVSKVTMLDAEEGYEFEVLWLRMDP